MQTFVSDREDDDRRSYNFLSVLAPLPTIFHSNVLFSCDNAFGLHPGNLFGNLLAGHE